MIKTETQIAQENVKDLKRVTKEKLEISPLHYKGLCFFHKATCQRFLEFLEGQGYEDCKEETDKITDLKQAIKLYEDNGI